MLVARKPMSAMWQRPMEHRPYKTDADPAVIPGGKNWCYDDLYRWTDGPHSSIKETCRGDRLNPALHQGG